MILTGGPLTQVALSGGSQQTGLSFSRQSSESNLSTFLQ